MVKRLRRCRNANIEIAETTWKAVVGGLIAVAGRRLVFDLSIGSHRKAAQALQSLGWWILKTTILSGPSAVVPRLKGFAQLARRWALTSSRKKVWHSLAIPYFGSMVDFPPLKRLLTSEGLLQLSYVGRALPPADAGKCEQDLRAMRDRYLSPGETPREILEFLRRWTATWASKHPAHYRMQQIPLSAAATVDSPRSRGGRTKDIVEWYAEVAPCDDPRCDPKREAGGVPRRDWEPAWGAYGLIERAIHDVSRRYALGELPRHDAKVIAERGWKTRCVTTNDAALVTGTEILRTILFSALRKDERIGQALAGDTQAALLSLSRTPVRMPARIVSADLSTATDGFHHDAYRTVWDTLCDSYRLTDDIRSVGRLALGPQRIKFPWGEEIVSVRGGLMGLSLPWAIMCLLNLASWDFGTESYRNKVPSSKWRRVAPCRILGDDLVGVCHPEVVLGYERCIRALGGNFNPKCHFTSVRGGVFAERCCDAKFVFTPVPPRYGPVKKFSKWTTVPRWGSYTSSALLGVRREKEEIAYKRHLMKCQGLLLACPLPFQLPPSRVRVDEFRRRVRTGVCLVSLTVGEPYEVFPIRGLVGPRQSSDWLPWWVTFGPTQFAALAHAPSKAKAICAVSQFTAGDMLRSLRSCPIPHTLPRELGGLSILTRHGHSLQIRKAASKSVREALAVMLYGLKVGESPPKDPSACYRFVKPGQWRSLATDLAMDDLSMLCLQDSKGEVQPFDGTLPEVPGLAPLPLFEVEEAFIQFHSRNLTLTMGLESEERFKVTISSVIRALGRAYTALRQRGRTSHPLTGNMPISLFVERRKALERTLVAVLRPDLILDDGTGVDSLAVRYGSTSARRLLAEATGWEGLLVEPDNG